MSCIAECFCCSNWLILINYHFVEGTINHLLHPSTLSSSITHVAHAQAVHSTKIKIWDRRLFIMVVQNIVALLNEVNKCWLSWFIICKLYFCNPVTVRTVKCVNRDEQTNVNNTSTHTGTIQWLTNNLTQSVGNNNKVSVLYYYWFSIYNWPMVETGRNLFLAT